MRQDPLCESEPLTLYRVCYNEVMFKLYRYLKPYWLQVLILMLSIGVGAWSTLRLPSLMAKIVNDGIVPGDMDRIYAIGLEMLLYAFLAAVGALVSNFFSARLGTRVSRDIRSDVFTKIMSFSITEINRYSTASLITRTTNDITQVQRTIILSLSMALRVPMMAGIAIVEALAIAPDMSWIIVLNVVVSLVLISIILALATPKFKIFQTLIDRLTLLTRENLTGLRVIRAFNNDDLEAKKFDRANQKITKTNIFLNTVFAFQSPLITIVMNGTTLLCIWIGVSLMETDISYLGNMMAFMQYAIQVIMSVLFLTMLVMMLPRANVAAARINEIFSTKPKIHWKKSTRGTPSEAPSVEFRNVSFAYDDADEEVLSNISFTASAGETTAFIGSTGSGKSTLINLVPRFYDATRGEVLVDGVNVKDYAENDLMKKLGYVPQKGVLFSGSIKSNINFGNTKAKKSETESAAEISQAKEFIDKLPEKYKTHIAQGGTNVSGGQKQRLSIARAINKRPEIFIFDDAFSALDMKTDAELRKALRKVNKNAVTLIVAQRISTIKDADQILVLDQGTLAGRGTHKSLLKTCKVYREIVKSQLSETDYEHELELAEKPTSANSSPEQKPQGAKTETLEQKPQKPKSEQKPNKTEGSEKGAQNA